MRLNAAMALIVLGSTHAGAQSRDAQQAIQDFASRMAPRTDLP